MSTISDHVIYRRVAPILTVCCLVLAIGACVGTYVNDRAIDSATQKRIEDNEANAVTNCQNANESRAAARTLWNFVFDLSLATNPDVTAEQVAYVGEVRAWVGKVYQERDCGDLSRAYPIPPPPSIPAAATP